MKISTSRSDYENKTCAKCKRVFNPLSISRCHYSKRGAYICYWCCRKCPYIERWGIHWRCTLWEPKPKGE